MSTLSELPIPLLRWYAENARDLPWRRDPTPYHVWLSEVMLQQTRVQAVLEYYRRFLQECPTVQDLADLEEDRLMKLWQGLGYYSRAKNLHKAARVIGRAYGGEFPMEYAAIRALPGVGEYTAGAIASIAFGLPYPAVDGNVLRVTARLTGDSADISTPAMKQSVTRQLQENLPIRAPGQFNQAMMELGAIVCLPNGAPRCQHCPVSQLCRAYQNDLTAVLPVKAPKKQRRLEQRDVFLVVREHRVAVCRRPEQGLLAGLWEFPNALSPCSCPVEGREERQVPGTHMFSHVEWHMTGRVIRAEQEQIPAGWQWVTLQELEEQIALPSAFSCFLPALKRVLGEEAFRR